MLNLLIAPEILALTAAATWALGDTSARVALRTSTPITGTLILATVSLLLFGPFAYRTLPNELVNFWGIIFLLGAGVTLGLARTLFNISFDRVGLSRSASIVSASPLVSVFIGVVWLAERPSWLALVGTLSIVVGVMIVMREKRSKAGENRVGRSFGYYFMFAVLATILFGLTTVLRKVGISLIPLLSLSLCVAALGTFGVIFCWYPFLPRTERVQLSWQNIGFFLVSGLMSSLSHLSLFAALQYGTVSVVAPLAYTNPLFVLVFSWLFLRRLEQVTISLVIGALMICLGAGLVTMSSG